MLGINMNRTRNVLGFLFLWLMCQIFWTFLIRAFTTHHSESAAVQGLATNTIA